MREEERQSQFLVLASEKKTSSSVALFPLRPEAVNQSFEAGRLIGADFNNGRLVHRPLGNHVTLK